MSETQTWKAFSEYVNPEHDAQRIESRMTGKGIPDVSARDYVAELKCLKSYPKKPTTPVVLDHKLTLEQYRWLNRRWRAGGKAFVILQANRLEWFCFYAPDSFVLVHKHEQPIPKLKMHAMFWSKDGLDGLFDDPIKFKDLLSYPMQRHHELRIESGLEARCKYI